MGRGDEEVNARGSKEKYWILKGTTDEIKRETRKGPSPRQPKGLSSLEQERRKNGNRGGGAHNVAKIT